MPQAESLIHSLEYFLTDSPEGAPQTPLDYSNFVKPFCFHPKGVTAVEMADKFRALEKFYKFEKYVASELGKLGTSDKLVAEGDILNDFRCRTLTSDAQVAAYRFSKMLVELDLDMKALMSKFQKDPVGYSIEDEYRGKVRPHEVQLLNSGEMQKVIKSFFNDVVGLR